jgi:hypothetical protein
MDKKGKGPLFDLGNRIYIAALEENKDIDRGINFYFRYLDPKMNPLITLNGDVTLEELKNYINRILPEGETIKFYSHVFDVTLNINLPFSELISKYNLMSHNRPITIIFVRK